MFCVLQEFSGEEEEAAKLQMLPLQKLKVTQLKQLLRNNHLPVSGKVSAKKITTVCWSFTFCLCVCQKADLIARLEARGITSLGKAEPSPKRPRDSGGNGSSLRQPPKRLKPASSAPLGSAVSVFEKYCGKEENDMFEESLEAYLSSLGQSAEGPATFYLAWLLKAANFGEISKKEFTSG